MSCYAVVIEKKQAFSVGARPVIYGLSTSASPDNTPDGMRCFSEKALPLGEQYRYVAFNPNENGNLDWTHEREWRWPNPNFPNTDGLALGKFSNLKLLVKNERQAMLLVRDIVRLIDEDLVSPSLFNSIILFDPLPNFEFDDDAVANVATSSMKRMKPFWCPPGSSDTADLLKEFNSILSDAKATAPSDSNPEQPGSYWLWLHDNTSKIARALVTNGHITISPHGCYFVRLPNLERQFRPSMREQLVENVAAAFKERFKTSASCHFALGSSLPDPDLSRSLPKGVSEYTYINYAHDQDDR